MGAEISSSGASIGIDKETENLKDLILGTEQNLEDIVLGTEKEISNVILTTEGNLLNVINTFQNNVSSTVNLALISGTIVVGVLVYNARKTVSSNPELMNKLADKIP